MSSETKSGDAWSVLDFRPPEPVSSSEIEDALRQLNEPSPAPAAALHRRASINLRRHVVRSAIRVTVLLSLDLVTYVGIRGIVRLLREKSALGEWVHTLVNHLFVQGFLGGAQFASALIVGLLVMGCYGPGD